MSWNVDFFVDALQSNEEQNKTTILDSAWENSCLLGQLFGRKTLEWAKNFYKLCGELRPFIERKWTAGGHRLFTGSQIQLTKRKGLRTRSPWRRQLERFRINTSNRVVFDAVSRSWNRFDWKPRPCKRSLTFITPLLSSRPLTLLLGFQFAH